MPFDDDFRRLLSYFLEIVLDRYKMSEIDLDVAQDELIEAFRLVATDRLAASNYMRRIIQKDAE
jgi:hypothetical protein